MKKREPFFPQALTMKPMNKLKVLPFPFLSFNPWVFFSIFLLSNCLLSYFSLPLLIHRAFLWSGLLLPFVVAWITYAPPGNQAEPLFKDEFLPPIPKWIWVLVGLAAVFMRFYKLTSLAYWPRFDEGMVDFYGLHVMEKGIDRFFFSSGQAPPLYIAWLGLNFKCWGSFLANSLFWPAFFSALTVPVAYQTARLYFSRSFSFICALLVAFSFWPWYAGRFSLHVAVMPLAETWILGWMGRWLQTRDSGKSLRTAVILGAGLGLVGYAVYLHWVSVIVVVALTVAWTGWRRSRLSVVGFFLALGLSLIPFAILAFWKESHPYLHSVSLFGDSRPWMEKISLALSQTWLLFWGTPPPYCSFQPVWGGFFNPILGSLVLLGLLETLHHRKAPLYQWLWGAGILWMIPGMLTIDWESFRIIPVLAVLIPLAALGVARLALGFSPRRSALVLLLLLLPSVGLDLNHLRVFHHLWDSPQAWQVNNKSIEKYRAYQTLKPKFLSEGPGLVFSDFGAGDCDPSLNLADYDFNPIVNPKLSFNKAAWAAVLVNVGYKPFLDNQFGPGVSYALSQGLPAPDGGQMLWVIPITEANRPAWERWVRAGQALLEVNDHYLQDISYVSGDLHQNVIPSLEKIHPLFQGDPFLETSYWEKMADYSMKAHEFTLSIANLEWAVRSGCPSAHLYYRLGVLCLGLQKTEEARNAFLKAIRAHLDLTQSALLMPGPSK